MILASIAAVLAIGLAQPPAQKSQDKPTSHEVKTLHGFNVRVDARLLTGVKSELGSLALDRLDCQLSTVSLLVPADRLVHLRKVTICLDLSNGELRSPQYHPSVDWLKEHGYDPDLAKCVHIPDAHYFVDARFQREQPFAILHELAHSYHHQVLGADRADIMNAYQKFVSSGKYASVLHVSGRMRPHYALTDPMEFFAEMTETYFGANDFYPFNSGELMRDEPELFKMMESIWGKLP